MSLCLAARRARLLAVRDLIDADGGGALHLYGGSMADSADEPAGGAPLGIVALQPVSFLLHASAAEMTLAPTQGFAALAGQVTWARYVSGAGAGVYDCTAGPAGSGAELVVVTEGTTNAQVYTGGQITPSHTIAEP